MSNVNAYCILFLLLFNFLLNNKLLAQHQTNPSNWQNLDLKSDNIFGSSTEKAYKELLKGRIAVPVIVAVIDGGIDIDHEDLRDQIWTNEKEISGNGKDDDGNGYIDDIHGWNFLGSNNGDFHLDNTDLVRLLRTELKHDPYSLKVKELKIQLDKKISPLFSELETMKKQEFIMKGILKKMGNEYPSLKELENYKYNTEEEMHILLYFVRSAKEMGQDFRSFWKVFEHKLENYRHQVDYIMNIDYDPRKDNREFQNRYYGNANVKGLEPSHGTHVSGIIAATRDNLKGINGISNHVKIMALRAIPEGEFRDEDLAYAIRYAVDNGAKIINLSISKPTSPNRAIIDQSVKYAMAHDVLIVRAAGNEGKQQDLEYGSPNRRYEDGMLAKAWIEVGASDSINDENIMPWFSNYGKNSVDVFAPGVDILSTYPNNKYDVESGTSMAAPVVSGLAAIIWAYYPKYTAVRIKEIILNSVEKVNYMVKGSDGVLVKFSDICSSGGIVNVFNALKLAESDSLNDFKRGGF